MMNYYNNPWQQRLNQMEQQYPQYAMPQNQGIRYQVIPVTNEQEALAAIVDTNGNPTFFYNKAKKEVYVKQFNINTGLADVERYQLATVTEEEPAYKQDFKTLNEKIDTLRAMLEPKGGKKNDKSNASHSDAE